MYNLLYIVSFAIFCHRLLHGLSPRQDELSAKDLAYTMQVAGICRDGPSIPWSVGSPRLDTPQVLRIPLSYFNSFELRKRQTSSSRDLRLCGLESNSWPEIKVLVSILTWIRQNLRPRSSEMLWSILSVLSDTYPSWTATDMSLLALAILASFQQKRFWMWLCLHQVMSNCFKHWIQECMEHWKQHLVSEFHTFKLHWFVHSLYICTTPSFETAGLQTLQ